MPKRTIYTTLRGFIYGIKFYLLEFICLKTPKIIITIGNPVNKLSIDLQDFFITVVIKHI